MTPQKRMFDLIVALLLAIILAPVFLILLGVLLILEGRPLFYVSERMHSPARRFGLIKLRTMRASAVNDGVTGQDKLGRISRLHGLLRRSRLDEIPQLWNVIAGHMSMVGPRPPLPVYVEDYPDVYGPVLRSRPGITGLASLRFHRQEERLLAGCHTAAQTDAVYRSRCIARKAQLDLIYQNHASICFDLMLMLETSAKPFRHR